jgi:hypothetical protein
MQVDSPVLDSRADFVFALGKKALRYEIFRLDSELERQRAENGAFRSQLNELELAYEGAVKRNEARLDSLLHKQDQIVDSRLGLVQPQRASSSEETTPVVRRSFDWRKARATFENDRREEYWRTVRESVEKKDKKVVAEKK